MSEQAEQGCTRGAVGAACEDKTAKRSITGPPVEYEIINPSDPYRMTCADQRIAEVACVVLGEGNYGGGAREGRGRGVKEIHFHETHVSIWEDWTDQPGEDREARRQAHFRSVEDAFGKLLDHLRGRGFLLRPDPKVDKRIRHHYWLGKKGHLELRAEVSGRTAKVEFFQNVANVENRYGGQHDFNKFKRMPRDLRLRCVVEIVQVLRLFQSLGYTFGPKSDLYEPLPLAVIRKAERREDAHLTPLERFNKRCWPHERRTAWATPEELSAARWQNDRKDKDGRLLCNGDERYFYDHLGRLQRGTVYKTGGNMWTVYLPGNVWGSQRGGWEFFSSDRPDLLPRKVRRESQVSRVQRELGKARDLQQRLLSAASRPPKTKLPDFLAWLGPLLWAASIVTAGDRVSVLEKVVTRVAGGERGYYVLSTKDHSAKDKCCVFFRPNAAGYVWALAGAGRFQESEILGSPSYYDNEETSFAVPIEAVEQLAGADGCVANTEKNRRALFRAAGEARGRRGQPSVLAQRKVERAKRKARAA